MITPKNEQRADFAADRKRKRLRSEPNEAFFISLNEFYLTKAFGVGIPVPVQENQQSGFFYCQIPAEWRK
jgi:hypothetical protein